MSSPRDPRRDVTATDPRPATTSSGFLTDSDEPAGDPDGDQIFRRAVQPPIDQREDESTDEAHDPQLEAANLARLGGWILLGLSLIVLIGTRDLPLPFFLALAGGVLCYLGSPDRLSREQVVDRWDCLIGDAQGRADAVLAATMAHIDQQHLAFISYETRDLAASLLRGGTRPFLVIHHTDNGRLGPYRMHVNVRDYGSNLQASWFLTYHRSFFERLKPNPLVTLNLFDEQDLRAYVTAVHHSFLDAVIDLMIALGQDSSRIERKTNGFLGIS